MRAYHYLICWMLTIFVGLIGSAATTNQVEFGFLFALASAALSTPFIIVFCIVMASFIRREPSKKQLHWMTLGIHGLGSLLTYLVIVGFEASAALPLLAIISIYFAFDSLLFHIAIELKGVSPKKTASDSDILDSSI